MAGEFAVGQFQPRAKIRVVGIGGCGGNAVSYMVDKGLEGADFIAANTDLQALSICSATKKIQLGEKTAGGLGVGCNPEKGKKATEESIDAIRAEIEGVDMVFLAGGLGGGTGTGGLPVVAEVARELGILTVAVVTKPFVLEGKHKMDIAQKGAELLEQMADSLIIIPNQRILERDKKMTFREARNLVDDVLYRAVRGIIEIVQYAGAWNVDMEDVKTIMKGSGRALMGMGSAQGENRVKEAIEQAIFNPLVENVSISGCRGALINITANPDEFTGEDFEIILSSIKEHATDDALIKSGLVERDDIENEVSITVIATGFDGGGRGVEALAANAQRQSAFNSGSGATGNARNSTSRIRRVTEVSQVNLEIDPEEFTITEEITSIPAYLSRMKNKGK